MQMIGTNSNSICILKIIKKLPGFSVQTFQFIVGKVYIYVGIISVLVVFFKVVLQQFFLIFMSQQKITFVEFCLIEFLFQINNRFFNRFLRLNTLAVTYLVDRLMMWCFNTILGYFYLSGASRHSDSVDISSLASEVDGRNFSRLPLIFTMCRIFLPHFKE